MKSKFTEQIYCICGDLDDMICDESLRKMTFNQYLAEYLKTTEHFDYVVFYLASRGMRVFDDESARELIGINQELHSNSEYEIEENDYEDEYEYEYEVEDDDDDFLTFDRPIPNKQSETKTEEEQKNVTKKEKIELSYSSRIDVADFASLVDYRLRDSEKKTAIIFESLMDYTQLSPDDKVQFEATFQYFLSDSLDDNENKVFFLAWNMDYQQIYAQIGNNDRLSGVFFQEQTGTPTVRKEKFIEFGKPRKDEIKNLLEHYRLYGYKNKFLNYSIADLNDYAYLIECYAQKAKGSSLNEINRLLQRIMMNSYKFIELTREMFRDMYPRIREVELPLEILSKMQYTEDVVIRLRNIKRYKALEKETRNFGISRFIKAESEMSAYGSRFLLKGIEASNRTKTAIAMADFLYYIGEVPCNKHIIVNKDDIRKWTVQEMEKNIAYLIQKAQNTVLIFDDLDTLTEMADSKKLIQSFHRCLLEELGRDRGIHFIMIVNTSKVDDIFSEEIIANYEIPKKNVLELVRACAKKIEDTDWNRREVADER